MSKQAMSIAEKKRAEIFGNETSAGDEGFIKESLHIIDDTYNLNEEQIEKALNFLYEIKNSFLGKTEQFPLEQIQNKIIPQIINHLGLDNISNNISLKCPKCKSTYIVKEFINGIRTGEYKCEACGYSYLKEAFETNLIKKTCKELGLTYKQLGEKIGYSESALNNASRQEKISEPLTFAINLYLENLALKEELEDFRTLKKILTKTL